METMDAKKTITLTMDEIKELTFQLEGALQQLQLQQQNDHNLQDGSMLLKEKIDFLREIILKINN